MGHPKVLDAEESHKKVCHTARSHLTPRSHIPTHRSHIQPEVCESLRAARDELFYVLLLNRSVVSRCIINPSSYWLGPKAQRKNTKVTPRSRIIICTIYYLVLLITYSSQWLLYLLWASVSMCVGIMCKHSCMYVCRCVTGDYVDLRWPFQLVP